MASLVDLNPQQAEAVHAPADRPLLVLAAAGTGKTRVLTARISHLIEGLGIDPREVLAMTFTRKAAGEMRRRVCATAKQEEATTAHALRRRPTIGTFHSVCLQMLRQHPEAAGLKPGFTVASDHEDAKLMPPGTAPAVLKKISAWREAGHLEAPEDGDASAARAYHLFRRKCEAANVASVRDFVSLALRTLRRGHQTPWRYVLVDEFQDTNGPQFELVRILSHGGRTLTVVGDDYQSIHGWRGAQVQNILDFEKILNAHSATVVRLELNYRSRPFVLEAASALIKHNPSQRFKRLVPGGGTGGQEEDGVNVIRVVKVSNVQEEARLIAAMAAEHFKACEDKAGDPNTLAILFRTNAATAPVEQELRALDVPYAVKGGFKFFARKEIRDAMSYVRLACGLHTDADVRRAMQVPSGRGVGPGSLDKVQSFAAATAAAAEEEGEEEEGEEEEGGGMLEALPRAVASGVFPAGGKVATGIQGFLEVVQKLRDARTADASPGALVRAALHLSGMYEAEDDVERKENLRQLQRSAAASYLTLDDLLHDADGQADDSDAADGGGDPAGPAGPVTLITMHASKGLEYDHVIMAGMARDVFPSKWAEDICEERRLCYVGITRARERLTMTCPGKHASQFVLELPQELLSMDRR